MAQAIARRAMKKMVNDSSSKPLLFGKTFMSNSASSTFGRIPQNQKSTKIISSFSPLTNKNRFPFLHPSSSSSFFPAARHMSSESGLFAKAWAFCGIQRAEAKAKVLDMMTTSSNIWEEITINPIVVDLKSRLNILEGVTDSIFGVVILVMCIQWARTTLSRGPYTVLVHDPYRLLLQFRLNRYVANTKVGVTLSDGKKVCVVYTRHTPFYSPLRIERHLLTVELPEGNYDGAKVFAWFDKKRMLLMAEIFSVKPATKVSRVPLL